jgi:putative toxin-antitoxin system antitoxin component (TIGR02293 family)
MPPRTADDSSCLPAGPAGTFVTSDVESATVVSQGSTMGARRRSRSGAGTGAVVARSAVSRRIAEVRAGLPLAELDQVAEMLGVDRARLAALLDTSLRTLQRKVETDGRLGAAASDRLARIKRIHELATHVLGADDKASRWLTSASRGLGGEVPLEMLDTDIGTQRVQQELREIEYGMPL